MLRGTLLAALLLAMARQLFALALSGTGLGWVYDSRYPRYCPGEVKFPLG